MADINKLNGYDIRDNRVDSIALHITEIDESIADLTADKQGKITGGATTIVNDNLQTGRALISNSAGKVAVSPITSTELGYLDNVTSNIQTQLNRKQANVTGGASTVTSSNLTANRALISNADGKIAVSPVTNTELGYIDGVTSNVQTQLDSKIPQKAFISQESDTNFNDLKPSGANEYRFDRVNITANTNRNQPLILTVNKAWNVVSFSGVNATYVWQTAYYIANNSFRIFTRPCYNNAWGEWQEISYVNPITYSEVRYASKTIGANAKVGYSLRDIGFVASDIPAGYEVVGYERIFSSNDNIVMAGYITISDVNVVNTLQFKNVSSSSVTSNIGARLMLRKS